MSAEHITDTGVPEIINHVIALRRAGHHAVISWLTDSYEASGYPAHHINDVYLVHYRTDNTVAQAFTQEDLLAQTPAQTKAMIINYEDLSYKDRRQTPAYRSLPGQDIVIVRDYANIMASRYQRFARPRKPPLGWRLSNDTTRVWLEHAELLAQSDQPKSPVVGINYNHWSTDADYRSRLASRLGIGSAPLPLRVPDFGGGSSFDGKALDGKANNMNLLKRWRDISPDIVKPYRNVLEAASPTLRAYNKRLFGIDLDEVISELHDVKQADTPAAILHELR